MVEKQCCVLDEKLDFDFDFPQTPSVELLATVQLVKEDRAYRD